MNVLRVQGRVEHGGHDVPEEKIRSRYKRCFQVLPEALLFADRAFLIDNSGKVPAVVAEGQGDRLKWKRGYEFREFEAIHRKQ